MQAKPPHPRRVFMQQRHRWGALVQPVSTRSAARNRTGSRPTTATSIARPVHALFVRAKFKGHWTDLAKRRVSASLVIALIIDVRDVAQYIGGARAPHLTAG